MAEVAINANNITSLTCHLTTEECTEDCHDCPIPDIPNQPFPAGPESFVAP